MAEIYLDIVITEPGISSCVGPVSNETAELIAV
jgi:hypothetical protein